MDLSNLTYSDIHTIFKHINMERACDTTQSMLYLVISMKCSADAQLMLKLALTYPSAKMNQYKCSEVLEHFSDLLILAVAA